MVQANIGNSDGAPFPEPCHFKKGLSLLFFPLSSKDYLDDCEQLQVSGGGLLSNFVCLF